MAKPGDHFQVGKEHAVIQGGRALAHAAADGIHQPGAGVGGSGLVALFLGALAQGLVIGKFLAGLDDDTIQSGAEDPQVGVTVFVGVVLGLTGAQHIPEIDSVAQDLGLRVGHGKFDALAVARLGQELFGFLQVEAVAVGAVYQLVGLHVQGIVHGFYAVLCIESIQVEVFRQGFGLVVVGHGVEIGAGQADGVVVSIHNQGVDSILIQVVVRGSLGDGDDLAGGLRVKLGGIQQGVGAGDLKARFGQVSIILLRILLKHHPDRLVIYGQVGGKAQGGVFGEGLAANGIGITDGGGYIHFERKPLRVQVHGFVRQFDGQRQGQQGLLQRSLQGFLGLALFHAAHIQAADGHAFGHPIIQRVGGGPDTEETADAQGQRAENDAGDEGDFLNRKRFFLFFRSKTAS